MSKVIYSLLEDTLLCNNNNVLGYDMEVKKLPKYPY